MYGLRQIPKPSKRLLEAKEEPPARPAKKSKGVSRKKKAETVSESAAIVNKQTQIANAQDTANDSPKAGVDPESTKPSRKRKYTPKQPPARKGTRVIAQDSPQQCTPESYDLHHPPSPSARKADLALDASIKAQMASKSLSFVERTRPARPKRQKKRQRQSLDIPTLRSLAAARGPQLTPDGHGIDLSPLSRSSPVTPQPPLDFISHMQAIQVLQKKITRGLAPPTYTPFDIVSGGRPPGMSRMEQDFWDGSLGANWVLEELPDEYGRMWRCVKMVGKFNEGLGWSAHVELARRVQLTEDECSPTCRVPGKEGFAASFIIENENEEIEGDVDALLRAFEDGEPEWRNSAGEFDSSEGWEGRM